MSRQKQTVFYSWQSDNPYRTNKNFILGALEKSAKKLSSDDSVLVEPVIDRDTVNEPGAPNITEKIFEKIEKASVFVADVTTVGKADLTRKAIPNPNVMLELGYALKVLGHERLILIANTAFGSLQDLPFDLKGRRTLPYFLEPSALEDEELLSAEKKNLQNALTSALKAIFLLPPNNIKQLPAPLLVLNGSRSLRDKITSSIGPRGSRISFLATGANRKTVTRDGLVIASNLNDPEYNTRLGIDHLYRVADDTREQIGDGSKTAMILCYAMIEEGFKPISAGKQISEVTNGLEQAVQKTVEFIKAHTQTLVSEDIGNVTMTAGGDLATRLLTKAFNESKSDGVITVEDSAPFTESSVEIQEGVTFHKGYVTDEFANDPATGHCIFEDCYVLVFDGKISSTNQIISLVEKIVESRKPVVIIAEDIEGDGLNLLTHNNNRQILKCVAVKAPGYKETKSSWLKDIAVMTGGIVTGGHYGTRIENADLSVLGGARKVIVSGDRTQIIGGYADSDKLNIRISQLRYQIDQGISIYDRGKLQERLANLAGGTTEIKVGGKTQTELLDNKYKVTTALHTTRSALDEGYVVGGGLVFFRAQEHLKTCRELSTIGENEKTGFEILINVLKEPLRCLLQTMNETDGELMKSLEEKEDLGVNLLTRKVENLRQAGVWDSSHTMQSGLEIAFSHAKIILETTSWETIKTDWF